MTADWIVWLLVCVVAGAWLSLASFAVGYVRGCIDTEREGRKTAEPKKPQS